MVFNLFSTASPKTRLKNERGAAMIEYALLLSLLALSLIFACLLITDSSRTKLDRLATVLDIGH